MASKKVRKRKPKRPDVIPSIPDSVENVAWAVLNTRPKKKWDYETNPPTVKQPADNAKVGSKGKAK